nr:sn-glycerol-1-phosphate dehydrogenase [Candidatus Sigynarchaeum springense]
MKIEDIVDGRNCKCGRLHAVRIDTIEIGRGVLKDVPAIVRRYHAGGRVGIFCDQNTLDAAGQEVMRYLDKEMISSHTCELRPKNRVVPDEKTIGVARGCMSEDTRLLLAVGSGTITDITRFVAHEKQIPFISIPTAPSVDGFVSATSALVVEGLKTSFPANPPIAIIADLGVLGKAPSKMKAAGFGDLLGKATARMDWELARAVNQEYYCAKIANMVQAALDDCIQASKIGQMYDEKMTRALMEGLLRSSLSAAMVGSTRPISGSEHHISHFLEMKGLAGVVPEHLHGDTVALGTYFVSALYHEVFSLEYEELEKLALASTGSHPPAAREARLLAAFGPLGSKMVESWRNTIRKRAGAPAILDRLSRNWADLTRLEKKTIFGIPELGNLMAESDIPFEPAKLGYTAVLMEDAILCAKEIRDRYTLLTLLDDLSLLEHFCKVVLEALDVR